MAKAGGGVPVALGLGGLAAVLLTTGITGNSLGQVFQGNFKKSASSTTGSSTAGASAVSTAAQFAATADAPAPIVAMINWCNSVAGRYQYTWGGGHGVAGQPSAGPCSSNGKGSCYGFDCSGAVSGALAVGGFLLSPETSGDLMNFGTPGAGKYVTVWANKIHTFMQIQGHWFGTGKLGLGGGPDWGNYDPLTVEYTMVHPTGY